MKKSVAVILFIVLSSISYAYSGVSVERVLPSQFKLDMVNEVNLIVNVDEANPPKSLIIEEYVPAGWTVVNPEPASLFFNPERNLVSWGFFKSKLQVQDTKITYGIRPTNNVGLFSGNIVASLPSENFSYAKLQITGDITPLLISVDQEVVNITNGIKVVNQDKANFKLIIKSSKSAEGAYMIAKTNSAEFIADMTYAINPSKEFYYEIRDSNGVIVNEGYFNLE